MSEFQTNYNDTNNDPVETIAEFAEKNSGRYEPTNLSPFHRNENGKLQLNDGVFPKYDITDIYEMALLGQQLDDSINNTFGDLHNLDMATVTIAQIRQAFGGITENFSSHDIFDVTTIIGETTSYKDKEASVKVIAMETMLKKDFDARLVNEARQYLESKDSSSEDLSYIFGLMSSAVDTTEDNLDITKLSLECLRQHPEISIDKKEMFRWLTRFYQHETTTKDGTDIIIKLLCDDNPDLIGKSEVTKQKLAQDIKRYLYLYLSDGRKAPDIQENYETFIDIEQQIPGIASLLEKELGVIDFGRYPKQLLLDQYLLKDDIDSPYGVLLYPSSDYNGAFHDSQSVLADFYEKLRTLGFNLRISERNGKFGAARSLLGFNKKYGDKQKISFAIIGGHGSKDSIEFGDMTAGDNGTLQTDNLGGIGVRRSLSNEFFVENPTIILNSCSTGAIFGIGQNISKKINCELIAPYKPTNLSRIEFTIDDKNKLHFNVRYADGEDVDIRYVGGQVIPDIVT